MFYENSIKNTTDSFKIDLAYIRLEVSEARRDSSYRFLEGIIFDQMINKSNSNQERLQ